MLEKYQDGNNVWILLEPLTIIVMIATAYYNYHH